MQDCNEQVFERFQQDTALQQNEKKTFRVVLLTAVMMVIEIVAGYSTGSMALLADGWHMASHFAALFVAWMAYRLARSEGWTKRLNFGSGKLIPLGGYSSALMLAIVALLMIAQSIERLMSPVDIQYKDAIIVAVIGLVVNLLSALMLKHDHGHAHDHDHDDAHSHDHSHDHNIRGAYLHVLADALTSILAIGALVLGYFYSLNWLDAGVGIIGAVVILKWAATLCRSTAMELLDGHPPGVDMSKLRRELESSGSVVEDMHIWRIAPNSFAAEIVIRAQSPKGSQHYRELFQPGLPIHHLVIEEKYQDKH